MSSIAASCGSKGNSELTRTVVLAELMRKESGELRRMYIKKQEDFSKSFCQKHMDNIPDSDITGQNSWEKLNVIYIKLRQFQQHLAEVIEQQTQLQEPDDPLLHSLEKARTRLGHLAGNVGRVLQCLQPNVPISESSWVSMLPPPMNSFQQKMYGCVVLTRQKEFLSKVSNELKTLKTKGER